MPNLALTPKENLSSFRRIAIGTWRTTYDPTVYGTLALRGDRVIAYLDEFRKRTGKRVTLSHFMAKAVAMTLAEMPDANAILRWNRIYLRKDIGVFFQVAMEDETTGEIDLSGATIFDAHTKSLLEIVEEFETKVGAVRKREDKNLEGSRNLFKRIPFFLLNTMLDLIGWLSFTLNLDLRWAGIPKDPFGSVMITNIGSLGLEEAYVPLVPYSRVPLLIALGQVKDEPVVEDGQIVPAKIVRAFATFDHRVLDGMHAAKMSKTLKRIFADPEKELGPLPPAQQ
ncbi:MAG: 2-oxo acid dehydrogenase subunit E2 [Deltaproteobacteria bacterium]|nr:2-oxo acid dehydrogenase subunit E2 [Deltaproteobacteria bacterium]